MKKLLIFMLVLGLASAANAVVPGSYTIQVSPAPAGPYSPAADSEITLLPSSTLWIGIHNSVLGVRGETQQATLILGIGQPPVGPADTSWTGNWVVFQPPLVPYIPAPINEYYGVIDYGLPQMVDAWMAILTNGDPLSFQGVGVLDAKELHCDRGPSDDTIWLVDADDGTVLDTILIHQVPEPNVSVLAPNGGEVLTGGDICPITWSSTGSISNVLIEYSTDNGSNWTSINTVPNTGSYNWLVPAAISNQCLVRVSDAADPNIYDISDGVFTIRQPTLNDGLVAYWSFDEGSGTTVNDSAGDNDGILYGDPNWVTGVSGNALSFDGIDDYVSAPPEVLNNRPQGTVFAWVYINSIDWACEPIISKGTIALTDFILAACSEGLVAHMGTSLYFSSASSIPLDTWTAVGITWDGASWKLYIDGNLDAQIDTSDTPLNSSNPVKIGRHEHSAGPFYFDGTIDEVRIYNRALPEEEIRDLYSSIKPDLEITSEDITFGRYPAVPGEPNSISATIWNRGYMPAVNIEVSFSDSTGPIGANQTIPILEPNQSATVSIQYSWPETSYQLITITVDPANSIEELDETNNTASKVYQIGNPADANAAILDISWNSAPDCYTEGTSAVIRGKADYRIKITGADDIVSPALGSIVTARIIDSNGVVTNLQRTLTGPDGYFYIPFIVPDADYGSFTIEISVTDGTLTGTFEKLFCIKPYIITPKKDLWICDLTVSDETPDAGHVVVVCATVCASPDNNDTVLNIPVTFYAYPPAGGAYQIGTSIIPHLARGESETVCVDWTPTVNGLHRIMAVIGISDDNYGNNYSYYNVVIGMFNVTANPGWAVIGQQIQITVESREPLPSEQLDSITVIDSNGQPISFSPADPCHPMPTRWIYGINSLPAGTALGTATITVTGTDSRGVQYTCQGYFEVYETPQTMPNFWLNSCDINFSNLNPALGEPITIDAVVHAGSSNPKSISNIPVTFYSKHLPSNGEYIKIGQTQYTGEILPGEVSAFVSVSWQNAAKGEYEIKASLEPGFSDAYNGDNAATRDLLVGTGIPFEAVFEVVNRTRTGRTTFEYECNVRLYNQTGLTLENIQLELTGVSSNMILVAPYTAAFANIGPNGSALSENTCTFIVDRSAGIDPAQITWHLTYQIVDICGIMHQTSSSTIILGSQSDITGDGKVDLDDLKILIEQWLQPPDIPSADIAPPPNGDNIVNFLDFAILADNWLK